MTVNEAKITEYFPLPEAREKQVKALDFIERWYSAGYRNFVIAAPTGIGKTGIGVAACLWATQLAETGQPGGYYLVTQKLLQDQLATDFNKFLPRFAGKSASLKSAVEYACPTYGTCMAGGRQRGADRRCEKRKFGGCPYTLAYSRFTQYPVSVTNYPYFFTERTYVGKLLPRQVMVCDECHTLEGQVLGFVELTISRKSMEDWAPHLRPVPSMATTDAFLSWLEDKYIPVVRERLKAKQEQVQLSVDKRVHQELLALESHMGRVEAVFNGMLNDPDNWVYWQERTDGELESTAKPIEAAPYTDDLLYKHASTRIFMSAYPGPREVFCRTVGLDPKKVAWCSLNSTFPVQNRPIHMLFAGSMGRASVDVTLPRLLRQIEKVLGVHGAEKGVIHCHSYKLGEAIHTYLYGTEHRDRILYATKASERNVVLAEHIRSPEPTVLLSPSMTEGFSLDDDLARFQVISKVPYPYLGDRQVSAKKDRDPEWYAMQTAMTIIQACGRIVRSDDDWGVTYIMDSDFETLYERNTKFFPAWLTQAFQWHNR